MKINKIIILSIMLFTLWLIVLVIFADNHPPVAQDAAPKAKADVHNYDGEIIQYRIEPAGKSECKNLGIVDLKGLKVNLVTLKSRILIVNVMEKIFYNSENSLPYRTERANSSFWIKDYRTEEYDQSKFTVVIKKFRGKKLLKEQIIKTDGPIQNMNTLLFYLRRQSDLKIGWHFAAKVLNEDTLVEYDLKLLSIDEIIVPAGKFQAYHFKSVPDTFEIWIGKNDPRIPLKIKIKGIVSCSLLMREYSPGNN